MYNMTKNSIPRPFRSGNEITVDLPTYIGRSQIQGSKKNLEPLAFSDRYRRIYQDIYEIPLWKGEPSDGLRSLYEECRRQFDVDKDIIHIHTQRQIVRLLLFLQADPPNGYAFDARLYIKLSIENGPSFADWLKDCRQAMMIQSLSVRLIEDNLTFIEEIKNNTYGIILDQEKYDYDSFLHEQYLYDFKDTGNDFEWSFKDLEEDESWITLFREAARALFKANPVLKINQPCDNDLCTWISDSVTQTNEGPKLNRKVMRDFAINETTRSEYESSRSASLRFQRQSVYVSPGNVRDTWQCYPETLFKVKRVSYLLRQILEELPNSAMASPYKAHHRRRCLVKDERTFFMFDYKKCGLTVNRHLLVIIGEVLEEIYPGQGLSELCHFEHVNVKSGDNWHTPSRGVGLGNCNEGITLIQCVLGEILKSLQGIDSIFFNDDGVFMSEEGTRIPFSYVITAIRKIGMIINLKKTLISDCNVFCEDYFVPQEKISYKKIQNLLIPFGNVLFKENIVQAKSLFNDLQRGVIGHRIEVRNLIPSFYQTYGYEFHSSEYWWPFELGGWLYYGETSVNEVTRMIFHWDPYVPVNEKGSIPFFREWAHYLISSQEIREFIRGRSNIPYRKFVPNPFKDWTLKYPHSEQAEKWIKMLGIQTNPERVRSLDDLYNIRGMKNAKPHIKVGKANKLLAYRKRIWRDFRAFRINSRKVFERTPASLQRVLQFLRSEEIRPSMYLPPDFMILRWDTYQSGGEIYLGRTLIEKENLQSKSNPRGVFKAIESIFDGYLKEDARPDCLRDEISKMKSRCIVSDIQLYDYQEDCYLPDWLYLFFPKKRFAKIIFFSKKIGLPMVWDEMPDHNEVFSALRRPITHIFPSCSKQYGKLMDQAKSLGMTDDISEILHSLEYRTSDEFQSALEFCLDNIPIKIKVESTPRGGVIDRDYLDPDELDIDYEFADYQLGERTDLDLIEEFEREYYEPESFEDSDLEYDYHFLDSDNRLLLASLKEASEERGRDRT